MWYEIVVFLEIVVKFWMVAVVVGLPAGMVMAMVECTLGAEVIYDHEVAVEADEVSVYEEDVSDDSDIYSIKVDEERLDGDILEDYEAEKVPVVLELLELAGFDVNTSGPAFTALMLLTVDELEELWETTVLGKQAA